MEVLSMQKKTSTLEIYSIYKFLNDYFQNATFECSNCQKRMFDLISLNVCGPFVIETRHTGNCERSIPFKDRKILITEPPMVLKMCFEIDINSQLRSNNFSYTSLR